MGLCSGPHEQSATLLPEHGDGRRFNLLIAAGARREDGALNQKPLHPDPLDGRVQGLSRELHRRHLPVLPYRVVGFGDLSVPRGDSPESSLANHQVHPG